MASTILRTNHCNKAFHVLGLFSLLLLIQKGGAYEFIVGGSKGWTVPTDSNATSYNQWAETSRFQIGDTILFVYPADKDSVLQVTTEDYNNCATKNPLAKYADGHTVFKFNQSGPHYFISGVKEHCLKNEKLVIIVLADRSKYSNSSNASPPSPGSAESMVPSPAPSGEESPSPPSGSVEINPTPAPSSETPPPPPPPNAASSIILNFIFSIGAFVGSSLLLVF